MKITGNIFLIFTALLLSSCFSELPITENGPEVEARGVINIVVTEQSSNPEDQIRTIRFIVFKNITTSPKVEVNEFWDEAKIKGENPTIVDGAAELTALLDVSRKTSGSNTKRVFVIVNEPTQMTAVLDGVTTYNELQNLQLDFSYFLNNNHTALENGKGLPMTGMVDTDKVYALQSTAEANRESILLERAVARIDLYIRKEAGVEVDLKSGSKITLGNSYDKSYFIRHETVPGTNLFFGNIQTVLSGFKDYTFTETTTRSIPVVSSTSDGYLICSFYTPERTCAALNDVDKLMVNFNILSTDGDNRIGNAILKSAYGEGESTPTPLTSIRRNNNYKIIATVEHQLVRINFTIWYTHWIIMEQKIIFD